MTCTGEGQEEGRQISLVHFPLNATLAEIKQMIDDAAKTEYSSLVVLTKQRMT